MHGLGQQGERLDVEGLSQVHPGAAWGIRSSGTDPAADWNNMVPIYAKEEGCAVNASRSAAFICFADRTFSSGTTAAIAAIGQLLKRLSRCGGARSQVWPREMQRRERKPQLLAHVSRAKPSGKARLAPSPRRWAKIKCPRTNSRTPDTVDGSAWGVEGVQGVLGGQTLNVQNPVRQNPVQSRIPPAPIYGD